MPEHLHIINPDRNSPWNDLPELPINSSLYRTVEIMEKLGNAKAALARLHGRSAIIPNQGLLINTISLQEAKMSSEIEHIFTTDDELYKAFSDEKKEVQGASKEVLRYREALWFGHHYLKTNNKFDNNYFIKIFQEIKQSKGGIRAPFSNTSIKRSGTGPNAGQVIYTPPRGNSIIENKLDNLISFLNNDEKYNIDHLIKMCIAHYQYEVIHPFPDGNGRTGRILNINYLTNKGLLDIPILFLSRYILDHKDDYYQYLADVSQRGNWNNWLLFMLDAIEKTSDITYTKINDIIETIDSILKYLKTERPKLRNIEKLIEFIFTQPYTKVRHLVEEGIYAENTAREYLNQLCELEVLEKQTIDGHHYYLNKELYRILSE